MNGLLSWRGVRITLVGCFLVLGAPAWAVTQTPQLKPFNARDMLGIERLGAGSIQLSPDGTRIAYVLADTTDEHNVLERRPSGYVYLQQLMTGGKAGPPRKLTDGVIHSAFPVWSPDGQQLAYLVSDGNGTHLAIWNSANGASRSYGAPFHSPAYLAPQWLADGRRVVYAQAIAEPEAAPSGRVVVVQSTNARIPGDAYFINHRKALLRLVRLADGSDTALLDKPLHLRGFAVAPHGDKLIYWLPTAQSFGLVGNEIRQTFLIDLEHANRTRLLSDDGKRFTWQADGKRLIYRQNGHFRSMNLHGEGSRPLLDSKKLGPASLIWSPDGKRIAALVPDPSITDPEIEPPQSGMYSIAQPFMDLYLLSTNHGINRNLTAKIPDQISSPVWSSDSQSLFFKAVDNESYDETLYRYDLRRKSLVRLAGGAESYADLAVAHGQLVFTAQSATHPPDLFAIDLASGRRYRIAALNPQLAAFRFSKPTLFHFYNADGERLGALLYRPVDVDPASKVPVITYVYEKLTPWIHHFQPRRQIFLNHGYAVLMPNVKVKVGETGDSFVKSVGPATNAVRAMGFSNGKFALWGGSFGAYATSFVITKTNLFACAVSRATPPELFRNWASGRDRDSDNIEHGQARMGGSPFEVMEGYLSQSAFFHLDKVHTPVLILHGLEDKTILPAEGEMMFYALRRLGKTATLVLYTHGDHSLYRHSRADAIDVHQRMLAWFDHYLKGP